MTPRNHVVLIQTFRDKAGGKVAEVRTYADGRMEVAGCRDRRLERQILHQAIVSARLQRERDAD